MFKLNNDYQLSVLLLAAGGGRRIGGNKPLTQLGGQTLLERAVEQIRRGTACNPVVVTGANHTAVLNALERLGCPFVHNGDWESGMGRSIAVGVRVLAQRTTHCMLALVDQPLIEPKNLRELVTASRNDPDAIAVSRFDASNGPPAIFPSSCFDALRELSGDVGARTIVRQHQRVVSVSVPGAEHDIDDEQGRLNAEALLKKELRSM
ncbi:MAG: nucleotidyltransferase family protein [Pseudomonadota bacterium]